MIWIQLSFSSIDSFFEKNEDFDKYFLKKQTFHARWD